MLGAIQPRAIRLNRIEQQSTLGAILHWVRNYCNWVARLVRQLEHEGRTIHLHYAGEIAATAILRHLEGQNTEVGFKRLLQIVVSGYRHATTCVHCLALTYLWQRFG